MNNYLFGHQILTTTLNFNELPRLNGAVTSSAIQIQLKPACQPAPFEWQHQWREADNTVTLSLALHEAGFLLRFPDLCDFIIDPVLRCIHVVSHDILDEHTLEHLLVDQVLPRFLAHEGHLLLHACAVNIEGRTVLFLGKSGWGKSTLAALLHKAGYRLYSDDCVLLQPHGSGWQILPTYPSLRLHEDSIENIFIGDSLLSPVSEYSDKQRIALTNDMEQVIPSLHAMYFLSDPDMIADNIQITPMRPSNTCIELIERSFRLDIGNRQHSRQLMESAAALTQSVPAYRLSYPRDYENNTRLLDCLIHHIQH